MERLKLIAFSLFTVVVFIFLKVFYESNTNESSGINLKTTIKENIELFKRLGNKYGTDKISTHNYHYLYGANIGQYRNMEINFLEIGLGCGGGEAGKSLSLWKEFMPKANIHIMEYDAECAEPFRKQVKQLFTGDQSNLNLMKKIGQEVGHFDVVVDDGGHSRKQQVNSLIGLWPFISSGGVYIIEDMYHSFVDAQPNIYKQTYNFNDNAESSVDLILELIILFNDPEEVGYIKSIKHGLVKPNVDITSHAIEISKSLLSISCFKRACVLHKK